MTVPAKPTEMPSDDEDDLRAFVAGDEAAFERIVDRHQRPLLALCQRLAGRARPLDPNDLFQDVFLQAYRSLRQLRSSAALRTWLFRIAIRRARRLGLAQRPLRLDADEREQIPSPESDGFLRIERAEELARLHAALRELPDRQREVVLLRHQQQLSFAEIAAALGIREDAARANHYQGLKRLRAQLDPPEATP